MCNSDEYRLILDMRKENHVSILQNNFMKEKYAKNLNLF